MKAKIHAAAGGLALLTIAVFWTSTVAVELFGTHEQIAVTKTAILYGMAVLIPALAATGATGFSLGGKWRSPIIARKKARMKFAAANGLLILLPSAVFLAWKAQTGDFGGWFAVVQGAELLAGAANIMLLSLNMKDGMALSRRRRAVA